MRSLIALFAASTFFAACAPPPQHPKDEAASESPQDALATSTLYGAWEHASGDGTILTIKFEKTASSTRSGMKGRAFTATIDNGVRCITTPCPSTDDVAGTYELSGTQLTLASFEKPTPSFAKILGDYAVKAQDGSLVLTKTDGTLTATLRPAKAAPPVECGPAVCAPGQYCCDPLHGRCVAMGSVCAQ